MEKRVKVLISVNGADFAGYGTELEQAGMAVTYTERDGRQLLDHIGADHPDIVLADLSCPGWTASRSEGLCRQEGRSAVHHSLQLHQPGH